MVNSFFCQGKRCSWHYHKLKMKLLLHGKMLLYYGDYFDLAKNILEGDTFHTSVDRTSNGGIEPELFEFSTQHFEDDSYRVIKGD